MIAMICDICGKPQDYSKYNPVRRYTRVVTEKKFFGKYKERVEGPSDDIDICDCCLAKIRECIRENESNEDRRLL